MNTCTSTLLILLIPTQLFSRTVSVDR